MSEEAFSSMLSIIVPEVVARIASEEGLDELTITKEFYSSKVYAMLSNEASKLWHYSPLVLTRLYKEERTTGTINLPEEAF